MNKGIVTGINYDAIFRWHYSYTEKPSHNKEARCGEGKCDEGKGDKAKEINSVKTDTANTILLLY